MKKSTWQSLTGPLCLFCAFALAGTSVVAARFVSGRLGVFTITMASLFFAGLVLLPLCAGRLKEAVRRMRKGDWFILALQAVFGIFLFRLLLLEGLVRTSTAEAGLLTGVTPAATAILAAVVLRERIHGKGIIGIACTVGGILLIQGILTPGRSLSPAHIIGNLLVIGAALSESTFNLLSRIHSLRTASRTPLDPMVQTALVSLMALALCAAAALPEHPVSSLMALGLRQWLALFWYGAFVTALAFICWYAGIRRCAAYRAAAFSGMMPLTALILSVALLGESVGPTQLLGGGLIILGMVLIGREPAGGSS